MAPAGPPAAVTAPDPACITTTVSATVGSVVWSGCLVHDVQTDPVTLDVTDVTVRVDGRVDWNGTTGVTSWNVAESLAMTMTSGPDVMTGSATIGLSGAITIKDGQIKGSTASNVSSTASFMGYSATAAMRTSMVVDLAYLPEPFCVTTGTLTLEQVWTRRPAGATAANYPDQGWKLTWTGDGITCGQVSVAHGQ